VLGVLPGIIGTLQALETIKLILGEGEPLIGRLVLFDALKFKFREFALKKNPECPVCGKAPTIHQLIDYEQFCGIETSIKSKFHFDTAEISVEELKSRMDNGDDMYILDVREPNEYEIANIGGHLIPLGELPERLTEIDPHKEIIVHCKSGGRSKRAVQLLQKAGFTNSKNLVGGIEAWTQKIDPSLARY
jgi:rhodanese-related sulfurtransferase